MDCWLSLKYRMKRNKKEERKREIERSIDAMIGVFFLCRRLCVCCVCVFFWCEKACLNFCKKDRTDYELDCAWGRPNGSMKKWLTWKKTRESPKPDTYCSPTFLWEMRKTQRRREKERPWWSRHHSCESYLLRLSSVAPYLFIICLSFFLSFYLHKI